MKFEDLARKAEESLLFTAPILGAHLERFLHEEGDGIRNLAQRALDEGVRHFYWVGCGNSYVNLWSAKYLLDRFSAAPSDAYPAYEFIWRNPGRLGRDSWVFAASFSGATEDTVAALRHANERGATTVAIVNDRGSIMGREADITIAYNSKALYILPLAAVYLFALEYCRRRGMGSCGPILKGLNELPALLKRQYLEERTEALSRAEEVAEETIFYTLGTGVLYGLAYKFGLTVFMENMRIHGSFIDTTEFRHGPVEMLDRGRATFVVLMGNDETREMSQRVVEILEQRGLKPLVFDTARYSSVHPLLAPFVLMIPLQWFAVYSAFLRGITDLDERVLMGHGILGKGAGVTWP